MATTPNRKVSASSAYSNGEKPLSRINITDIDLLKQFLNKNYNIPIDIKITLKQLRDFLKKSGRSSWHRTSIYGTKTNFYSFAHTISDGKVTDLRYLTVDQVNDMKLCEFLYFITQKPDKKTSKNPQNQTDYYFADVSVGTWEDVKRKPRLVFHKKQALIMGKFAYILGTGEKKRISGTHFRILNSYTEEIPHNFKEKDIDEIKDFLNFSLKLFISELILHCLEESMIITINYCPFDGNFQNMEGSLGLRYASTNEYMGREYEVYDRGNYYLAYKQGIDYPISGSAWTGENDNESISIRVQSKDDTGGVCNQYTSQ